MGARKRNSADERKEAMKSTYFARLVNCPTSPRKMRLVADMIRGKKVNLALYMLKYSNKEAAPRMEKLLLSALSNWQAKNEGVRMEDEDLFIKEVHVDSGRQLKRLRTAPQGRGHRIRKRSNHITLIVDNKNSFVAEPVAETAETQN
jgi:large subunit ribosomal protein L22